MTSSPPPMSDPNTAFPEYAKRPPFNKPSLVFFFASYGAISLVADIVRILWKIAR